MTKARDRADRGGSDPIIVGNTRLETDSNNDLVVKDTSDNAKKVIASEVHVGTGADKVILKRSTTDGKLQLQTTDGSSATNSTVSGDSGGAGGVTIQEEGSALATQATTLNFVGDSITASGTGATKTITISASSGGTTTVYANIAAMTATSPSAGDQALVTANSGLYIYNGSGWYKIATVNTSPTISSPSTGGSVTLATDGTATSIELVGADVDEGTTLQNSYAVTTGSLTNGGGATATVTTSATSSGTYSALAAGATTTNRFFKITPSTDSAHAGSFSITFSMSDSINAATTVQSFELAFASDGSYKFDGTGDYISVPDSDDWYFGTGDFTIEAWVYPKDLTSVNPILGQWNFSGGNAANSWVWEFVGTELDFYTVHGGTTMTSHLGTKTLSNDKWYHVALQRSSGTIKQFIDGSEDFSVSNSNDLNNGTTDLGIGVVSLGSSPSYWDGYISNARIVKGSAVYSVTAGSPGSLRVDGYDDRATGVVTAAGTNDFTLECWFNPDVVNHDGIMHITNSEFSGSGQGHGIAIAFKPSVNNYQIYYNDTFVDSTVGLLPTVGTWHHVALVRTGGYTKLYVDGVQIISQADTKNYTSNNIVIGAYYNTGYYMQGYISDVRYVVGTAVYTGAFTPPKGRLTLTGGTYPSTTNVNTSIPSGHCKLLTANEPTSDGSGTGFNDDSLSNVSLTGYAGCGPRTNSPYGNTIDAPTDGLSTVTNTKLLTLKAGSSPSDASSSNHTLTKVGDTAFSHVTPFVNPTGGSTDFEGATGTSNNGFTYVDSPVTSSVSPGNGDWTIEYWINSRDISAGTQMPFDYNYSTAGGIMMYINTTGRLVAHTSSVLLLNDGTGSAPEMASNTWYHVALVRHNNELRMYQNGILCTNTAGYGSQDGSHPFTSNLTQTRITIGVKYFGGHDTYPVDGSISNFRLVVGTAVYTGDSSFTPPTSPLTAITNTQLLTCQNSTGTITDASSNGHMMIVGSGAVASKHNPF